MTVHYKLQPRVESLWMTVSTSSYDETTNQVSLDRGHS